MGDLYPVTGRVTVIITHIGGLITTHTGGVIRRVTAIIGHIGGLIPPLIATHEAPSGKPGSETQRPDVFQDPTAYLARESPGLPHHCHWALEYHTLILFF